MWLGKSIVTPGHTGRGAADSIVRENPLVINYDKREFMINRRRRGGNHRRGEKIRNKEYRESNVKMREGLKEVNAFCPSVPFAEETIGQLYFLLYQSQSH